MIPARTLSVFVMGMENFPGFSAKARTRKDASCQNAQVIGWFMYRLKLFCII